MASRITGIREYRAALKRAPAHLREEVFEAVKDTTESVHARGKANITSMTVRRTGILYRNYRRSLSKASLRGRVGYLSESARDAAFYARFINDGTVKMAARPFHTNAVEAEREADTARMVRARDKAIGRITR